MLEALNRYFGSKAVIRAYCGPENRKEALRGADFAVNAIQVGGYEPCTVTDFEIPKKYGLRQTIADTLGIGGIFRALRTIPVVLDFARDMEEVCPDVLFLNYSNPMAMLTGAIQQMSGIETVGLCHSVQVCCETLLRELYMDYDETVQWKIAGINHQAWLLSVTKDGQDLYPEIKRRARLKNRGELPQPPLEEILAQEKARLGSRFTPEREERVRAAHRLYEEKGLHDDMVRMDLMLRFGYYITESSEHNAEYTPYYIKAAHPELIDRYHIPLDEYPRRCIAQIADWKKRGGELTGRPVLEHERTTEYASYIMDAVVTNKAFKFGGNVQNTGLITNLPKNACVEVPVYADASKLTPGFIGDLPEQCAALNRTNINVQLLTIEAAKTHKKDLIYNAAMLDPHTSSELTLDEIVSLCDDLIEAHGSRMPHFD